MLGPTRRERFEQVDGGAPPPRGYVINMTLTRPVSAIMTEDVITLHEEDDLLEIDRGMQQYQLRHLPVVDGRKLVGLVTHRDLLRVSASSLEPEHVAAARDAEAKSQTFVSSVMTRSVKTVSPDTPLSEAVRALVEGRFGCLPVVDDAGDLVGIVTEHDMLKLLVEVLVLEDQQGRANDAAVPKIQAVPDP